MTNEDKINTTSDILQQIKTPLTFFALALLILETILLLFAKEASGIHLTILIIAISLSLIMVIAIVGIITFKNPTYLFGLREIKLILQNKEISINPKTIIENELLNLKVGQKISTNILEQIKTLVHIIDINRLSRLDEDRVSFAIVDAKKYSQKLFAVLDRKETIDMQDWQLIDYFRARYAEIDINVITNFKKLGIINSKNYLTIRGVHTLKYLAKIG